MYKECKSSLSLYGPKRAIYYIYRIQRLRYCDVNNDIGTIDLPNTVLRLVQASLFPFSFASKLGFLSEILAAFPLFVKKHDTIHNRLLRSLTFFRSGALSTLEDSVRKLTLT